MSIINRSGQRLRYNRQRLQRVLDAAVAESGIKRATLTIVMVNDAEAAALHSEHFGDAATTDVMTFPDGDPHPATGVVHLGDLVVCVDVARRVATARLRPPGDEITLYCLHGLLHLLDYDDVTPAQQRRMWAVQVRLLAGVGIAIEAEPSAGSSS